MELTERKLEGPSVLSLCWGTGSIAILPPWLPTDRVVDISGAGIRGKDSVQPGRHPAPLPPSFSLTCPRAQPKAPVGALQPQPQGPPAADSPACVLHGCPGLGSDSGGWGDGAGREGMIMTSIMCQGH